MHSKKITVRFASAVSAAVIGFTSTAISFFDCPVYAAYGGAAWGEFFGFYSLLEGFGFGQDNTDFINSVDNWIDSLQPEEKPREDYDGEWMTDAQYWQQCQYDKFTGWLDNLVDSWSESYDAVGDVGSGGASGAGSLLCIGSDGHSFSIDNLYNSAISDDYHFSVSSPYGDCRLGFDHVKYWSDQTPDAYKPILDSAKKFIVCLSNSVYLVSVSDDILNVKPSNVWGGNFCYYNTGFSIVGYNKVYSSLYHYRGCRILDSKESSLPYSDYDNFIDIMKRAYNIDVTPSNYNMLNEWFYNNPDYSFSDVPSGFIGPVYTYPAAQELARQNKTSTGIRLDVKTADGVPDVKAALDGAGVSTVDELAASVAAGDVAMQDVFADAKVTPYVVADTASGVVVTDLGVAADAAGVKPVALTKELTVPADLTNAATYAIQGKTWDPDMAKYRLPLFQYFPFCLPWDIYQVLNSFAADPVAPQIEIPIGKFFANKKSFDGSAVANYTETLDLGDEKFSKWFSALRLLESAGIIIGLVLISVHLIHGGR